MASALQWPPVLRSRTNSRSWLGDTGGGGKAVPSGRAKPSAASCDEGELGKLQASASKQLLDPALSAPLDLLAPEAGLREQARAVRRTLVAHHVPAALAESQARNQDLVQVEDQADGRAGQQEGRLRSSPNESFRRCWMHLRTLDTHPYRWRPCGLLISAHNAHLRLVIAPPSWLGASARGRTSPLPLRWPTGSSIKSCSRVSFLCPRLNCQEKA